MKPVIKLGIKVFLATGVPYGLIMSGFAFTQGKGNFLLRFFLYTFSFGSFMALFLVISHIIRLKKTGVKEINDETVKVCQERRFKSGLNMESLIQRLKEDAVFGKMKIIENENEILLKTKVTLWSFGEDIKIVQTLESGEEFEYLVTSRPKLKTSMVDYGKNLQNVSRIADLAE